MKKLIAVVLLGAAALSGLYAQSGTGDMISASFVKEYNNYFVDSRGSIKGKYLRSFSDEEIGKYSALGGSNLDIDTAEEIAFLSYASGVVDIRPPEAAAMLPKNRESDLKIGALMYQNLQTAAFLRTANAAAYATLFNQFCAENNISKAEVKTYFDRNIAAAIAAEVDAQFNRVSFLLDKTAQISYGAVLTRNTQNQYVLSYEDAKYVTKEISASSLQALLDAMQRNTTDFSQTSINQVRAQAALIPAVVFAQTNVTGDILGTLKAEITRFYTEPNARNYETIKGLYEVFLKNEAEFFHDNFFGDIRLACGKVFTSLNEPLAQKIFRDANAQSSTAAAQSSFSRALSSLARNP